MKNKRPTRKVIHFDTDLKKNIQSYADKYLNGNFTMAVRYLCVVGLKGEES